MTLANLIEITAICLIVIVLSTFLYTKISKILTSIFRGTKFKGKDGIIVGLTNVVLMTIGDLLKSLTGGSKKG